jgi:folate-dependent phosphoribosylglycinamide formyltransferase PurN
MFQAHHEGGSVVDQAKVPFVQRKEECIGKQNVHRELMEHILLSQIIERSLH